MQRGLVLSFSFAALIFLLLLLGGYFVAYGQATSVSLTVKPTLGEAPLNNVDLSATVDGESGTRYTYKFDCTSDGIFELTSTKVSAAAKDTATNLCNYPTAGNYTAKVVVDWTRGAQSGTVSATAAVTVFTLSATLSADPATGTVPLGGVDLTATLTGAPSGSTFQYQFDCTNDGVFDFTTPSFGSSATHTAVDVCKYLTDGTHTASVRVKTKIQGIEFEKATTTIVANPVPAIKSASSTISIASGGQVVLAKEDGNTVSFAIPAGAISADGATTAVASIEEVSTSSSKWVDPPQNKIYMSAVPYDITVTKNGQTVTTFDVPIVLQFTWLDSQAPAGVPESSLEIGFFDAGGTWNPLGTSIDTVNNVASSSVTHLTRFALVAAAGPVLAPPPPPPVRSSFFVWELREGELVTLRPGCEGVADLNFDNRINLIDFSVLAFWYQKSGSPSHLDINKDGKVNAADFSILIYCWTR